jgi:uncharacterized protein (UPF0261 family)
MTTRRVYVIGTFDTKRDELLFAVDCLHAAGALPYTVDISTGAQTGVADLGPADVAAFHPGGVKAVLGRDDRGEAVSAMAEALKAYLVSRNDIGAVLGLGGSGNTSIVTAAMRALPVGIPKIMVSTVASGNVAPYVGPSDITMMRDRQCSTCSSGHGDQFDTQSENDKARHRHDHVRRDHGSDHADPGAPPERQ